jgi:hypothetical protein
VNTALFYLLLSKLYEEAAFFSVVASLVGIDRVVAAMEGSRYYYLLSMQFIE